MIRIFYDKNLFEKIRTDVKIGIFLIPIAHWSGFGIFKENQNPDKIRRVVQSDIVLQQKILFEIIVRIGASTAILKLKSEVLLINSISRYKKIFCMELQVLGKMCEKCKNRVKY